MNQLTPEQIKTLEDAFASYPEDFKTNCKYSNMNGIQEQLNELDGKSGNIFYISKVNLVDKTQSHFTTNKMKVVV